MHNFDYITAYCFPIPKIKSFASSSAIGRNLKSMQAAVLHLLVSLTKPLLDCVAFQCFHSFGYVPRSSERDIRSFQFVCVQNWLCNGGKEQKQKHSTVYPMCGQILIATYYTFADERRCFCLGSCNICRADFFEMCLCCYIARTKLSFKRQLT